MHENLVRKVDERGQDNLIARLFPRALTTAVKIVGGAGELARGTVLSRKEDGTCEVMVAGGTPAYILADPRGCLRRGGRTRCRLSQRQFQPQCGDCR